AQREASGFVFARRRSARFSILKAAAAETAGNSNRPRHDRRGKPGSVAMTGITVCRETARPVATTNISKPEVAHGPAIHRLVAACKPLDLNSRYAYLLLCEHFADTCALARAGDRVVGFVSAYRPPGRDDTLFVWQVAVDAGMRGRGLAKAMLSDVLARDALRGCRYLETRSEEHTSELQSREK